MTAIEPVKKPALGVCYYPEHWPKEMWADDAKRIVECGIEYVRIAEFAWSRIEATRDKFNFEWLDSAIETLGAAGLKVVMCTPTATPPKWLVDEMPDMVAVDSDGNPRKWGSRRHYDFSHEEYRKECARITMVLAKRYGSDSNVVAWQTDNEYGCHDTTLSYSESARDGFRNWLAQKYQSPDALNKAWGNVFWSMEVESFNEVELPNLTVTEPNPSHVLDYRRFASDQVVAFNRIQTGILRKHSPGRDIIHNFMGRYLEFDHFDVSADLDIASWDSYPIGFLEQFGRDHAWKNWYMRAGDPDFQAFHHDLYRACGNMRGQAGNGGGRWWVMEQQPGPVNWAPYNPDPHPGMVRLWSHEAFAHGAEVVSYFRWRQAPFAQEQFHAGLNRPDNSPDRGFEEAEKTGKEISSLPNAETAQSAVALLVDYPSLWATETQPQGAGYHAINVIWEFYSTLRQLGQSVDIVSTAHNLDGYKLIVVPQLLMVSDDMIAKLDECEARIVFGPRCGSRTMSHHIPEGLAPGNLRQLIDIRVDRVESLRPGVGEAVEHVGAMWKWIEHVSTSADVTVESKMSNGRPAWMRQKNVSYVAGWPDEALCKHIMQVELEAAGVSVVETGDDLRIRDRGNLRTILNYGPKPRDASHLIAPTDKVLIGSANMDVAGVTVVQRT